jgi:hypothetical protein
MIKHYEKYINQTLVYTAESGVANAYALGHMAFHLLLRLLTQQLIFFIFWTDTLTQADMLVNI